ncbi:MAG: DUF3179 domain-containing (seleno)protein [Desulfosarcinaceae bacterium]|jgi:hypothetical protein
MMFPAPFRSRCKLANPVFPAKAGNAFLLGIFCLMLILAQNAWAAEIVEADGKTSIVDQTGERWEISQAMTLGFRPEGFQFGIGRNAIRPLRGEELKSDGADLPESTRIIGIADEAGDIAHAYSVRRLTRHEIANTQLGATPIAAAY